jgi:hypothetical protein
MIIIYNKGEIKMELLSYLIGKIGESIAVLSTLNILFVIAVAVPAIGLLIIGLRIVKNIGCN